MLIPIILKFFSIFHHGTLHLSGRQLLKPQYHDCTAAYTSGTRLKMVGPVEELKNHHDALLLHLKEEPSLALSTGVVLSKALLLAGASELETDVQRIILDYFAEVTGANVSATSFVSKSAVSRHYHTFFTWDANNANSFFGLFGADFKAYAGKRVREDEILAGHIKGFLRIGFERNQLVHGNFAAYSLSLTADEIFELYEAAVGFRDALPDLLRGK